MSASSVETKGAPKSSCSTLYSGSVMHLNFKPRLVQRKNPSRQSGFMTGSSGISTDIRQRVLSARQNRHKDLQSQLNLVLQQNAELVNENRLLKTLYKRQDNALAKYEGSSGELPQLINSHVQEVRVWQTKYRALNLQNRDLSKKVQQKDKIINDLNDRLKHLTALTAEKHLEEREVLQAKIEMLEHKMTTKEDEIKMLTRRNMIEAKNYKSQLSNERKKYKELCQKQNAEKQNGSSNDSDYSSAKDIKEMKHGNNHSLSASSAAISEETVTINSHGEIDEDDDLVIKRMIDRDNSATKNDDSDQQIAQQLADIHLFTSEKLENIHEIQQKMQNDIAKNETFLDLHCEEIGRDIGIFYAENESPFVIDKPNGGDHDIGPMKPIGDLLSFKSNMPNASKVPLPIHSDRTNGSRPASSLPRFNINLSGQPKPMKRTLLDPQKKSKLLAQLKSIDAGNECL